MFEPFQVVPERLGGFQTTGFLGPTLPGSLQTTVFADPAPPGDLQTTSIVDPEPPGGLESSSFLQHKVTNVSYKLLVLATETGGRRNIGFW